MFPSNKCLYYRPCHSMSLFLLLPGAGQTDGLLQGPGQGGAPGLGQSQGEQPAQQPRPREHRHGQPGQPRERSQRPDIRGEDGAKPSQGEHSGACDNCDMSGFSHLPTMELSPTQTLRTRVGKSSPV